MDRWICIPGGRHKRKKEYDVEAAYKDKGPLDAGLSAAERRVEALEVDNRQMLQSIDASAERIRGLQDEVQKSMDDLVGAQRRAAETVQGLEGELEEKQGCMVQQERELGEANERARRYRKEREGLKDERASLLQQLETLKTSLEDEQRTSAILQRDLEQKSKLLDVRSTELRDAQAYLGKEDTVSSAEIIRTVEALNGEIYQAAAQIANECSVVGEGEAPDRLGLGLAASIVSEHLGATMVELLMAVPAQACDDIVVQMALQALLAQVAAQIVDSWVPMTKSPAINCFLGQVYENLYISETQAISAKWRTLARRYSRATQPTSDLLQAEEGRVIEMITHILTLAGARVDSVRLSEDIRANDKIKTILAHCVALRDTIGEGFSSSDFSLFCSYYGNTFDINRMENVYADVHEKTEGEPGVVLCVLDLGLARSEKTKDTKATKGMIIHTVPLKAKVVTTEAIHELLTGEKSDA